MAAAFAEIQFGGALRAPRDSSNPESGSDTMSHMKTDVRGRVRNMDLKAARAMISLMQPKKDGTVALDLIAKEGKLYWGPIMIGSLAPVF